MANFKWEKYFTISSFTAASKPLQSDSGEMVVSSTTALRIWYGNTITLDEQIATRLHRDFLSGSGFNPNEVCSARALVSKPRDLIKLA